MSVSDWARPAAEATRFVPGLADGQGSFSVWAPPEKRGTYALGADFGYGLQDRDFDCAVVLRIDVDPWVQVAELHGAYGELFHRPLLAVARWYRNAWVCGESQLGLLQLRHMLTAGYGRIYYNRDEFRKGRPRRDVLGYWARNVDLPVRRARLQVADGRVEIRSPELMEELERYVFKPRSDAKAARLGDDALTDADLVMGPTLGHDDRVRALCYAMHMATEAPVFEDEEETFEEGTLGHVLGHAGVFDDEEE